MINYLIECYRRRHFMLYASYLNVKSRHFNTLLGNFWLVINPVLLAGIYYMLVLVLSPSGHSYYRFLYIVSGIFSYYYTRNSIHFISTSLTNNKTLIKETAFPKLTLPIYYLFSAILMYVPAVIILLIMSIFINKEIGAIYLLLIPLFLLQTLFNFGIGVLCAIGDLYTKDIEQFLPFMLRIWVYITPILFEYSHIYNMSGGGGFYKLAFAIIRYNPLTPIVGTWNDIIVYGKTSHVFFSLSYTFCLSTAIAIFATYLFYRNEHKIIYRLI